LFFCPPVQHGWFAPLAQPLPLSRRLNASRTTPAAQAGLNKLARTHGARGRGTYIAHWWHATATAHARRTRVDDLAPRTPATMADALRRHGLPDLQTRTLANHSRLLDTTHPIPYLTAPVFMAPCYYGVLLSYHLSHAGQRAFHLFAAVPALPFDHPRLAHARTTRATLVRGGADANASAGRSSLPPTPPPYPSRTWLYARCARRTVGRLAAGSGPYLLTLFYLPHHHSGYLTIPHPFLHYT